MTLSSNLKLSDFPEYIAATDRLAELRREHSKLEQRVQTLRDSVRGTNRNTMAISREAALLTSKPPAELENRLQQWEEIEQAERRLPTLEQAIRLQSQIVEDAKRDTCRTIRKSVEPEQRRLVSVIAEKLRNLQDAIQAERTFRDHYVGQGVGLHNPAVRGEDTFKHWFSEQKQLGLLDG